MTFDTPVFAADVKVTGSYYVAGIYQNNTSFVTNAEKPSTAFYYQRLRVQTDFIATPALRLVTRFDAMERIWGHARSTVPLVITNDVDSAGTRAENENIAFDWAYIWYVSKIGLWQVGVMEDGVWGTVFADNAAPELKITWTAVKMPFIAGLQVVKIEENSKAFMNMAPYGTQTDVDVDEYQGFFIFNWKSGKAGLLGVYHRSAISRPWSVSPLVSDGYKTDIFVLEPYVKAKIGPVSVEAEIDYAFGKLAKWENGVIDTITGLPKNDVKVNNLMAYVDVVADFDMFYVGGTFAFMDGDKPETKDKIEGGVLDGGRDWNPCLLMFNWERAYWAGTLPGYLPGGVLGLVATEPNMGGVMNNAWFGQIRAGVRPILNLDIMGSVSYAKAVRNASVAPASLLPDALAGFGGTDLTNERDYGWEIDVVATYKITNNLNYMLGGAYFFTGDYYKGKVAPGAPNDVEDNYLIINKLTFTF